ncbi:MAG: hypothetical protein ACI8WT_002796 [Clostridium sp.]|jgi:hypothetical protein
MKPAFVLVLVLLSTGLFFIGPYYLTERFRKHKVSKYIPSMLSLITILILYIKATFFQVGYSAIADIVFMILFAISLVILLLIALLFKVKKY